MGIFATMKKYGSIKPKNFHGWDTNNSVVAQEDEHPRVKTLRKNGGLQIFITYFWFGMLLIIFGLTMITTAIYRSLLQKDWRSFPGRS